MWQASPAAAGGTHLRGHRETTCQLVVQKYWVARIRSYPIFLGQSREQHSRRGCVGVNFGWVADGGGYIILKTAVTPHRRQHNVIIAGNIVWGRGAGARHMCVQAALVTLYGGEGPCGPSAHWDSPSRQSNAFTIFRTRCSTCGMGAILLQQRKEGTSRQLLTFWVALFRYPKITQN